MTLNRRTGEQEILKQGAHGRTLRPGPAWISGESCNDAKVNVFIRQLTGIRFIAAAWVLLYHFQGPLGVIGLTDIPVFGDVVRVGRLGVDLFFALSGFILTHTYLTRMGPRLHLRATAEFWWLRLARIYPVHLVMIVVAGVAMVAQARINGTAWKSWFTPQDAAQQLLLVQEWGPNPERGWNFVAWSISMEWLAYLAFPLLVLALWVFAKHVPSWLLAVGWVLALAPLLWYALDTQDAYYMHNWGSTIRIATEFTAGAITYLIVRRLHESGDPTPQVERIATAASFILPALVIAGAVILANLQAAQPPARVLAEDAEPLPPFFHLLLVPLLIAWIGALALSRRGLARWLATSTLILGGFISYSLYMTHMVWFGLWRVLMNALGINGGALYAIGVIGLIGGALVIAWLMWRIVEEPAREWMRARVGVRKQPTEEAGEAIVLQSDSTVQHDAEPISVPMADPQQVREDRRDE
jgi:peptidoglycan/LPS O-acetylase OafA/YrhL